MNNDKKDKCSKWATKRTALSVLASGEWKQINYCSDDVNIITILKELISTKTGSWMNWFTHHGIFSDSIQADAMYRIECGRENLDCNLFH